MIPKSHKVFKEGIAEEVGVHSSVVDEFVNFYYEKVRENLSALTNSNILWLLGIIHQELYNPTKQLR